MGKVARGESSGGFDVTDKDEEYPAAADQEAMVLRGEHFQTVAFLAKSLSDENRLRIHSLREQRQEVRLRASLKSSVFRSLSSPIT